jgi:hypothetical protein
MPQAQHASGPSPPLSPAAKQLARIMGSKQPIAHKEEAIKDVVSDCDCFCAGFGLGVL